MKRKVTLNRIFHREGWRIGLFFDYDEKIKSIVKSIPGTTFSMTLKCFYVDDTEESIREVFRTLKDAADIDISDISLSDSIVRNRSGQDKVINQFSRNDSDNQERPAGYREIKPPVTITTVEADKDIKSTFGRPCPVEFRINESEGLLVIRFTGWYEKEWIKELNSYGRCYYDKTRKEWSMTWSKLTVDSLADYFALKGVEVKFRRLAADPELAARRKAAGDEIRSRPIGSKAKDGIEKLAAYLDENRYSVQTRGTYLSALEFFFRYFIGRDPDEITGEEISRFIYDHIIKHGYSASYQNQMISAIKTYYQVAGRGRIDPEILERPRRRRALPKVFSREEVTRILNSARNIKHKTLLWIIYSCGLRRSEITNIRISDLDRDRQVIHVKEGKGMVDRIVPVPSKVWEKIDDYQGAYNPRKYLFEGQSGGRYSKESVYRVFKAALLRAGIAKEVGVHSLRHSYATHLHESGLDIKYIQELLGHRSTKTTEIYTHVSRRNLVQVRSPIEDLDVR